MNRDGKSGSKVLADGQDALQTLARLRTSQSVRSAPGSPALSSRVDGPNSRPNFGGVGTP